MNKSFNWLEDVPADNVTLLGEGHGCNTCPNKYPLEFKNVLSYKEYKISGICQSCQDEVFKKPADE